MKNKLLLFIFLYIVVCAKVMAWTEEQNMSISEFVNYSKADNVVEIGQEDNKTTDGKLGLIILLALGGITLLVSAIFTKDAAKLMTITSFLMSCSSLFLRTIEWTTDNIVFACFGMMFFSIGFAVITR